jgi:glycosyltransferase involved in cell wall biosynthesis
MRHNRTHVLQVIGNSTFGGATRVILAISRGLKAAGYRVSVLTSDPRTQEVFAGIGATVIPCRHYVRQVSPVRDALAVAETRHLCRLYDIDVLHTHTSKGGAVGRLAAWSLGLPVVHTVHGFSFHEFSSAWTKSLFSTVEWALAPLTTRMVLINSDEQRLVRHHDWLPRERTRLIVNGIPIPPLPPAPTSHEGCPHLVTVGRLSVQKGYRYLLGAMPAVLERFPHARLSIVGDGEERARLEALTAELGLAQAVTFTGFQTDPLAWLGKAHVAVSSSLWEGLPIAVLEMMAARRPIVATACRGTRDVLTHGEHALLVPPADPDALAQAIIGMLSHEPRAHAIAEAARAHLEDGYTESRMVQEYVTLFRELMPAHGIAELPPALDEAVHGRK